MQLDDDDSENDSDYVPEEDAGERAASQRESITLDIASTKRKRKACAAWDELCAEDRQYVGAKITASAMKFSDPLFEVPPRRIRSKIRRYFKEMRKITTIHMEDEGSVAQLPSQPPNEEVRKLLEESLQRVKRKTVVIESRKFAGQEIQVQKTVSAAKTELQSAEKEKSSETNLDKILQTLKGPKTISTVTKSAVDWDTYKEKEGISDDIEAAAKDGYRGRQDFLQACDVRNFEIEKEQRILNREQ